MQGGSAVPVGPGQEGVSWGGGGRAVLGWGSRRVGLGDAMGNEVRKWLGVKSQSVLFATLRNLAAVEVTPGSTPRGSAGVEAGGADFGLLHPSQLCDLGGVLRSALRERPC